MSSPEPVYHPVIVELLDLINANCWRDKFDKAIEEARSYNVPNINKIKNFDDYINWINDLLRWVPEENKNGKEIYDRVSEFYFFLGQPSIKSLQNIELPLPNSLLNITPLSKWMVNYANAMGKFMDTTESINPKSLATFYNSPPYNMDEYMECPSGYKTYNQFFARHVKPGMRPIASPSDNRIIVSPADCTFVGWWQISAKSEVTVKGLQWTIKQLLNDSVYSDRFKGGIFTHSFLNTTDYHRLHVPVAGTVLEAKVIQGLVFLDVVAIPVGDSAKLTKIRQFDALDATGYQFMQARGLLVLDSPIGLVAVLPIGMAQVSSVVMTAEVGKTLQKGEEFSYFQFGGSDVVMVFEAKSNITFFAQPNVHNNQGTCIGQSFI